jgi:hypothetical protein
LKYLEDGGVIVVHDCNPISEITQRVIRASDAWHGDVWKAVVKLRMEEPNLSIHTVDTDEGCAIIKPGKQELLFLPDNTIDVYNYDFLSKNRVLALNLISVNQFKQIYIK